MCKILLSFLLLSAPVLAVTVVLSCKDVNHIYQVILLDYGIPGLKLNALVHEIGTSQLVASYGVLKIQEKYVDAKTLGRAFSLSPVDSGYLLELTQNHMEFDRIVALKLTCPH